jgi:hypothetical protein
MFIVMVAVIRSIDAKPASFCAWSYLKVQGVRRRKMKTQDL